MVTHIDPVCKNLKDWQMLTLINWYDQKKDFRTVVDDKIVDLSQGNSFIVFDFQSQSIVSKIRKGDSLIVSNVNPHQSKLLKILPWDEKSAIFIGTDLNFTCGGVEISDIKYESGNISGILDTQWYLPVTLTFLVPKGEGFEIKRLRMLSGQRHFVLNY